ncbi:MAG TPA: hypothetical protein DCS93_33035 [Microscillaceae bacterium]|nr:hypothetical protein [Microscillaceae bacterium]
MKNKLNIVLTTLALLFIIQISSQAQYNKKDLIGKWKISLEHIIESLPAAQKAEYDKLPDKDKQATILMLQQMLGNLRWEFKEDGSTKVNLGDGKEQSGTWKMNGKEITLKADGQDKKMTILKLSPTQFRFSSIDDTGKKIIMTLVPLD